MSLNELAMEQYYQEQEAKCEAAVSDPVNHPAHYNLGGIEVLSAIEAWELPYHLGNVVKYIARAGKKNPDTFLQDLQKAQFYLNRFITRREEKKE